MVLTPTTMPHEPLLCSVSRSLNPVAQSQDIALNIENVRRSWVKTISIMAREEVKLKSLERLRLGSDRVFEIGSRRLWHAHGTSRLACWVQHPFPLPWPPGLPHARSLCLGQCRSGLPAASSQQRGSCVRRRPRTWAPFPQPRSPLARSAEGTFTTKSLSPKTSRAEEHVNVGLLASCLDSRSRLLWPHIIY